MAAPRKIAPTQRPRVRNSVHPSLYISCMNQTSPEGDKLAEEHLISMHRLHEVPLPGKENKFVITETEAWFVPFEDNSSAPLLAEILVLVLHIDLADEEAVAEVGAKLEDGRILLGYISGEGRDISVHLLPGSHDVAVRSRLREVFGANLGDAVEMGTQTKVRGG